MSNKFSGTTCRVISSLVNIAILVITIFSFNISDAISESTKIATIKVATLNTFLRGGGVFPQLFSGGWGKGNTYDTYRAKKLAELLSGRDYDIIALQEIWDTDADEIMEALSEAGYNGFHSSTTGLYLGFKRSAIFAHGAPSYIFDQHAGTEAKNLSFVTKGYMYSLVNLQGHPLYVVTTHTQSDNYTSTQVSQVEQIMNRVDSFHSNIPVLFMGDLNVEYGTAHYSRIMSILDEFEITDTNNVVTLICEESIEARCESSANQVKIDYILKRDALDDDGAGKMLVPDRFSREVLNHNAENTWLGFQRDVAYLSDHALLSTEFTLYEVTPDKTTPACPPNKIFSEPHQGCIPEPRTCTPCSADSVCKQSFIKYEKPRRKEVWDSCKVVSCDSGLELFYKKCKAECRTSTYASCLDDLPQNQGGMPTELRQLYVEQCARISSMSNKLTSKNKLFCNIRDIKGIPIRNR